MTGTPIDKIGYFGLTTWELQLDGLRVPGDALQDTGQDEGQGFKDSLRWLGTARVQTAARAVGLARGAVEDAIAYCRAAGQFGHAIADHQVIRHTLADMSAEVEAARAALHHAAWLLDSGEPADIETSQAKLVRLRDRRAGHRPRRCRSSAATVTPPSTRSSATGATPG